MQYRIGARDPVTGLYEVIHPDGSRLLNGIKIFNAAYTEGDTVLATQRSDGMMILDSVSASENPFNSPNVSNNSDSQVTGVGAKPTSYLTGQVFNNEEEPELLVWVDFNPESLKVLTPGELGELALIEGAFFVRVQTKRPVRQTLLVQVELSGIADRSTYRVTSPIFGDLFLTNTVTIFTGTKEADIVIQPNQHNLTGESKTIVLKITKVVEGPRHRVGKSITAIMTYLPVVTMPNDGLGRINATSNVFGNITTFTATLDRIQSQDITFITSITGTLNPVYYAISRDLSGGLTIPAGSLSISFTVELFPPASGGQFIKTLDIAIEPSDNYRRKVPIGARLFLATP